MTALQPTETGAQAPSHKTTRVPCITVVAALIVRGNAVLIQQRHPQGPCANLWELPGGKIELGEAPQAALVREAKEELGVSLTVGPEVFVTTHTDAERTIALQVFAAHIARDAAPLCHAAQQQLWCDVQRLGDYAFCPADVALIDALVTGALPIAQFAV